ncbi:MAG TPA: ABC transporter permease [Bryobacteraceae bacterium]|nr:ABC transporter permease [Bryobacteraceae bacterium]
MTQSRELYTSDIILKIMFLNDLRYALRLMRRSPGFTAVAVLSLALGIGANTAIYSLFYTIMLRQLPVAHPEQLVEFLFSGDPSQVRDDGYWDWDRYEYIRDHNHVLSALTGMSFDNLASLRVDGSDPQTVIEESVLGNYFEVLGLKPAIGRLTTPDDVPASGEGEAAVVSWSWWNSRFHRDPSILGKRILVNDQPRTIVGVAPRGYSGPRVGSRTDVWVPYQKDTVRLLARIKPGVTRQQAQAEMRVLLQTLVEQKAARNHTKVKPIQLDVEPAGAGFARVREQYGKALMLLLGVVGLLLLLACINMASLLLARSAGRQRELAVRVGLGAGRGRLVRQMLTEAVMLSAAGTLAGMLLAYAGTGILVRIMASGRAFEHIDVEVHPDFQLLAVTTAIGIFTAFLFGLAPAMYAFRATPANALRQSGRGGDTWFWRLFGRALVAAQVALSIFLVTGTAVFLAHLSRLRNFELGFRSDHVLLMTLDPDHSSYKSKPLAAPYQRLLERLQSIPGVRSSSITACTPLEGCGTGSRFLNAEGFVEQPEQRLRPAIYFVTPRYFETLGIPLLAGRDFSPRDVGHPRVVIISNAVARHYFPGQNPIGRNITVVHDPQPLPFGDDQPYEIVGVAGDVKPFELRDAPFPTMYFDMFQVNHVFDEFQLRTSADPAAIAETARRLVREALPDMPVTRLTTLAAQVDSNIVPERLIATLSEFFGGLGAVLAGIGIYGLLAFSVARRTNEIGVRMALGATPGDVSRLVLRDTMGLLCAGLVVGSFLVVWGRPLAASLIPDLKPASAGPLALAAGAIAAVALLASYVPVRRATRVDPMEALRHE